MFIRLYTNTVYDGMMAHMLQDISLSKKHVYTHA